MGPNFDELVQLAFSQAGLFTSAQARTLGFSWSLLSHHARKGGKLIRLRRGLYRLRHYPSSPGEELMAAWLASGPDAVISHDSALSLFSVGDLIPASIHVTVPRNRKHRPRLDGVALHTAVTPPGSDEVMTRDGMRVTSPWRSILDVAASGGEPDHVHKAIADALGRGLTTPDQLRAGSARYGRPVARLVEAAISEAGW